MSEIKEVLIQLVFQLQLALVFDFIIYDLVSYQLTFFLYILPLEMLALIQA